MTDLRDHPFSVLFDYPSELFNILDITFANPPNYYMLWSNFLDAQFALPYTF